MTKSKNKGKWMTPAQAEANALTRPNVTLSAENTIFCLIPPE